MGILVGFAPFLAFFVGIRRISPVAGLAAACLVSLYLCLRMWRSGASVKVLEVGSLVLFAALLGYTLLASPAWTIATVRLAVDAGLFAIAAISLAIGKPFTLQYAREQVPAELWESPRFIAVNRHITLVWAIAFAVMVAADAAAEYMAGIPIWVDVAVTLVALGAAILFTIQYPRLVRRAATGN